MSPQKLHREFSRLPVRSYKTRSEMTQEEVAKQIGTDSGAISRFERGLREPSLLELLAFSRMCGVGVEVLIDDKIKLAWKR